MMTASQTSNGTSAQRRYAYDRWGNRTGVWNATSGGTQIQSVTLQQNGSVPTNRIQSVTTNGVTATCTYDAAGNVSNDGSHGFVYDGENRVVSLDSGAASYAYDFRNRRVKKVASGTTTHYLWEGGQVLAEYNSTSGWTDYIYAGGKMIAKTVGTNIRYFINDPLGLRLLLDSLGSVVGREGTLPYGEDIGTSGELDKHHYTSYERDAESGLDYAVNRFYNSSTGRFYAIDPVRGDRAKPQRLNRYTYTTNDPVNRIDPLGLYTVNVIECSTTSSSSGSFNNASGSSNEECTVVDSYEVPDVTPISAPSGGEAPGSGGGETGPGNESPTQKTEEQCTQDLFEFQDLFKTVEASAEQIIQYFDSLTPQIRQSFNNDVTTIDNGNYVRNQPGFVRRTFKQLGRTAGSYAARYFPRTTVDAITEAAAQAFDSLNTLNQKADELVRNCKGVLKGAKGELLDILTGYNLDRSRLIYRSFFSSIRNSINPPI